MKAWRRIARRTVLLVGCGLSCLTGCDRPNPEIRVGVVERLSGDPVVASRAVSKAASLAVQQVNEEGGVLIGGRRHPIKLLFEDDEGNIERAIAAVRRLINQQHVIAIIGPQWSRHAIPAAQIAEEAQIPLMTPSGTNPAVTAGKQYVFRVSFNDEVQGRALANFAYQDLGARKVAILYDVASPYQATLVEVFKPTFEAAGGQVVAIETYTTDVTEYRGQLERIRDRQPELLFLPNYADESLRQARQARQLGIAAVLLGADSWSSIDFPNQPDLEGSYFSTHWHPDLPNETSRRFVQAYSQAYGETPGSDEALSYDAMGLLLQALREQDSLEPRALRDGLASLSSYSGVTGAIRYQGSGDPQKPVYILRIQNRQPVFYQRIQP